MNETIALMPTRTRIYSLEEEGAKAKKRDLLSVGHLSGLRNLCRLPKLQRLLANKTVRLTNSIFSCSLLRAD